MNNDWRIDPGPTYLINRSFEYGLYIPTEKNNSHDHCCFCWKPFYLGDQVQAYVTIINGQGNWVCEQCFHDFMKRFGLSIKQ
jgi:Zn-finger protein